ncbi:unnamed protein product [Lota lota]
MAVPTATDAKRDNAKSFQRPNHVAIIFPKGSVTPEFSASSSDRAVRPANPLVMEPSGAVGALELQFEASKCLCCFRRPDHMVRSLESLALDDSR